MRALQRGSWIRVLVGGAILAMGIGSRPANAAALKAGDRVVFLGDSITQAGAAPGGYVALIREALQAQRPDEPIEVIGAGISGNKVPDLQRRLDQDVLSKQPTVVVIYIGINDVWHSQNNNGTPPDVYRAGLRDVIARIQARGARVVLCTPSVIGEKTDASNPLDKMLDDYSATSREVAQETNCQLIDLRQAFLAELKRINPDQSSQGRLTSDGVHLNAAGNQFVAATMLSALTGDAAARPTGAAPRRLRHVVLFKFKEGTSPEKVDEIATAFAALPKRIDTVVDFEWGTDNSPEGLADGFTHCFFVSFASEEGRAAYLPHAAHQEFVQLLRPHLDKVLVVDYWAK